MIMVINKHANVGLCLFFISCIMLLQGGWAMYVVFLTVDLLHAINKYSNINKIKLFSKYFSLIFYSLYKLILE